ncbi:hypothetical protein M0811_02857 [Anaeramoeba ignava]|uniref:Reverse transcriptase domain-containing protein n=1 Tax=Anaeramoeba ignava TaxID=1746090 RepID=A0A9Q0L8D1_ANAIG|nr:hypothetical protein M0811_02857 [Anaeramoeba ignava]
MKAFIQKSLSYSYLLTYGTYLKQNTKKEQLELFEHMRTELERHHIEIDTKTKKTVKYNSSQEYINLQEGKILNSHHKIKIQKTNIGMLEIANALDKNINGRVVKKGKNLIEIWDNKKSIDATFKKLERKKTLIKKGTRITRIDTQNNSTETIRGSSSQISKYFIKVASWNINGLIQKDKEKEIEATLLKHGIDVALIQETHMKKKKYFQYYNTILKPSYGTLGPQGGLNILYKKFYKPIVQEIENEDKDIQIIKIADLHLVNIYKRHDRAEDIIQQLQNVLDQYGREKTIIAGDFNMTAKTLQEKLKLGEFKRIRNKNYSRNNRNIDHLLTTAQTRSYSRTIRSELSDHNCIYNICEIKANAEFKTKAHITDSRKFQRQFVNCVQKDNFKIKETTMKKLERKWETKSRITITNKVPKAIQEIIAQLQLDPNKKYKLAQQIKKQFNNMLQSTNIDQQIEHNEWKTIKKIRGTNKTIQTQNKRLEEEFSKLIDGTNIRPDPQTLHQITQLPNPLPPPQEPQQIQIPRSEEYITIQLIQNTITKMANKAVRGFDKIENYKNTQKEVDEEYEALLNTLRLAFLNWRDNPTEAQLKYIKANNKIFIHKGGETWPAANYRPIAISNALPRIFLKIIYSNLEQEWDKIAKTQYGFRKLVDTRIATIDLLEKYNTMDSPTIMTLDITKCFDNVNHQLIRETIKKFVDHKPTQEFLIQYYAGDGYGTFQGDPLSPIIFAFTSHYLIGELEKTTAHTQMFADDVIMLLQESIDETKTKKVHELIAIYRQFGLKINESKTIITKNLNEVKYLGIHLERTTHIKNNLQKANATFEKYIYIFTNPTLSNAVKLQIYEAMILAQTYYGTEIFNITPEDIKKIDTQINSHLCQLLRINRHSPTLIYRTDAKIWSAYYTINKRKWKLQQKLRKLGHPLAENLKFTPENNKQDEIWKTRNQNQLKLLISKSIKEQIQNSESKKTKKYYNMIKDATHLERQKYLKWNSSTTLLKIRMRSNGLNGYSYRWNKNNQNKTPDCPFCDGNKENLKHALLKCPQYDQIRPQKIRNERDLKVIINKATTEQESFNTLTQFMNEIMKERAKRVGQ